jgi:hypothetical protein
MPLAWPRRTIAIFTEENGMTFEPPEQPPEPPVGSQPAAPPPEPYAPPPPPSPPQEWAAPPSPAAQSSAFNPAAVSPYDWGILAAGFLALVFSWFSYYTVKVSFLGLSRSDSEGAWHGFFGWFAALLALAAAALLAIHLFAPSARLPFPLRLTIFGGFALALVFLIIAAFVTPGAASASELSAAAGGRVSVDYGRGVGFYLSLIVILAGGVLSFLRLRETGGSLPWEKSKA